MWVCYCAVAETQADWSKRLTALVLGRPGAWAQYRRHPVNEEDIRKVFGRFGEIVHIKTGLKDFVFIDFTDMEACDEP